MSSDLWEENEEYKYQNQKGNYKNCYDQCEYYYYIDNTNNYICLNNYSCLKEYNKFISAKKQCIDDCSKDDIYKYQFKSECYQKCPPKTWQSNKRDNFCEIICSKESPFEILENQECTNNCSIKDFYQ